MICQKCQLQTDPAKMNGVHCIVCLPKSSVLDVAPEGIARGLDDIAKMYANVDKGKQIRDLLAKAFLRGEFVDGDVRIPATEASGIESASVGLASAEPLSMVDAIADESVVFALKHLEQMDLSVGIDSGGESSILDALADAPLPGSNVANFRVTSESPIDVGEAVGEALSITRFGSAHVLEFQYVTVAQVRERYDGIDWIEVKAKLRKVGA